MFSPSLSIVQYELGAMLHRHLGEDEDMGDMEASNFKDSVLHTVRNLGCWRLLASMLVLLPSCKRDIFWGWYEAAGRRNIRNY